MIISIIADTVSILRKMACKNDTDFDKSEGLHDDQWRERTSVACKAVFFSTSDFSRR